MKKKFGHKKLKINNNIFYQCQEEQHYLIILESNWHYLTHFSPKIVKTIYIIDHLSPKQAKTIYITDIYLQN